MNLSDNIIRVSLIIPFYNVEKYIERCIDSIINQTYRNLEIIMVNDGSLDHSREIVLSRMTVDSRIKLIDRENGGLSAARNTGLEHASGKYIIFVDSDDWAEETFVEKLLNNIEHYQSDMACCRLRYVNLEQKEIFEYGTPYNLDVIDNRDHIIQDALEVKNIHTPVWAKIYRREFLKLNNLNFYEGIVNEDTLFTTLCAFYADKVSFVNEVLFNSLERSGSISRSSQERLFRDMHFVLTKLEKYVSQNNIQNISSGLIDLIRMRYIRGMLYNLLQSVQRLDKAKFIKMHNLCISETNYKLFKYESLKLPFKYSAMYLISLSPNLFWLVFQVMTRFGFKMH